VENHQLHSLTVAAFYERATKLSASHVFSHKLVNVIRDKSELRVYSTDTELWEEAHPQIRIMPEKQILSPLTWMLMMLNIQHFNSSELDPPISDAKSFSTKQLSGSAYMVYY